MDKKTGKIKELKQKIEVKHQFRIKAKYNYKKNETRIEINLGKEENKQKTKQALPGLVIVKLIAKLGNLNFEF